MQVTVEVPVTLADVDAACRAQCCFPEVAQIKAAVAELLQTNPARRITTDMVVKRVRRLVVRRDRER